MGVGPLRAESLADPGPHLEALGVVEPDEAVRRVEDGRLRTVVPAQDHGPCRAVPVAEAEDVVDRGAPERVDGLVVIADHGDVAMRLGEEPDQLGLGAVRVLELVHEDVAEPPRDLRTGGGRLAHEPQGERHLVAEVDAAVGRQQVLVRGVGPRELTLSPAVLERRIRGIAVSLGGRRSDRLREVRGLGRDPVREFPVRGRADVLVLAPAEQRRKGTEEPGRVAERAIGVELELEEVLAEEDHDLGTGQDTKVRRQPELERVLADQAVAERVEGRDRRVRVAVWDELVNADRHLLGRLVRESEGEDLGRPGPTRRHEPGDPARDHLGLARPGAGHDEERAVVVGHGAELVRVQAVEQRREPRPGFGHQVRIHDRDEVMPGRQLVQRGRLAPGPQPWSGHRRLGGGFVAGVRCVVVGSAGRRGGHARTIAELRAT